MTILAIIVAATIGLAVGAVLGGGAIIATIRRSGYAIEVAPGPKTRYRIGVRTDAAPVVPAVEWIAPRPSAPPLPYAPATNADLARYGHKPRGGGRP